MITPPLNHHLFSWQRMLVVFILGLVVLAGCISCGGGGSGDNTVSPGGNFSLVPPPAAATRAVELKAVGSQLPTLEPYWGKEYTGLVPKHWQVRFSPDTTNLIVTPTAASGLQYALDPELKSSIWFSRYKPGESYDANSHVTKIADAFSEINGLDVQPLGGVAMNGGVLRIFQYTEAGIDSRLVVMSAQDSYDERYIIDAGFKTTTVDFTTLGGTDLFMIVAGSARLLEEAPVVEVVDLQNLPMPGLEGTGFSEADLTLELRVLEYAVGRTLTDMEKARLAASIVQTVQRGVEWTTQNYAGLRPFYRSILENAAQAEGRDYAPTLRWLIKDYLLDSFYRGNPLEHGSPLVIQLLNENNQAADVEGEPPKYSVNLAGLESLSVPDTVAVQGINLAKLYQSPLIQNTWQRVINNDPSEYTQRLLSGYRQQFNLPQGQAAQAVVKSFMPQGNDLLSVLGSGQDPNAIITPFKARNVDLQATADDTSLYLGASAAGKTVGVRFLTWGHIAGNEGQLRSLPNTMVDGSDAQVREDMPLIRVRAQEAWPILLAGAQLNW